MQGLASLPSSQQTQILKEVEALLSSSSPSPLATKLGKFVKIALNRWGGEVEKMQGEQARLENLLEENAENISVEKVLEFRVRLQLLREMQE